MNHKEIERFLQYLIRNLLPSYIKQEEQGEGENYWNADFWTIEVAKCLYVGDRAYLEPEYTPSKFLNNKNYNKKEIINHAMIKKSMFEFLKEVKDDANELLVCEVGRGLDILIANMVKKWDKIYCYDQNKVYGNYLKSDFNNIEFYPEPTVVFDPEVVDNNTIAIINHSRLRDYTKYKNAEKIVHLIADGKLIW